MRKLIETKQEHSIVCDNISCDFAVPTEPNEEPFGEMEKWLNVRCPKCGWNLLTKEDYLSALKVKKTINWLNKWCSWLTIFSSKKAERKSVIVKAHKGIHIK